MISNKNCVIRLSQYKNALYRLKTLGFVKVFSDNLGDAIGVASSQVRKDFSIFGITGSKKGGYKIDELIEKLNDILGKNEQKKVIIVGIGNIGNALIKYKGFEKEGMSIVAGFDSNTAKHNPSAEIPILPIEKLKSFIETKKIKVGIIAVPDIEAQRIFEIMLSAGIKGFLNFAPIRLVGPEDCIINNVNIALELENVIYYVNGLQRRH